MNPLPLFDGLVNGTVLPEDEIRLSRQCRILYRRLKRGPATNTELIEITSTCAPSARRSDLRKELQKYGWGLARIKNLGGGVNLYGITDPNGRVYCAGHRIDIEAYH